MARRFGKGQSAMEYLITYGWALLILLAVLTTLYSMGLFRPSRYMPQECVFQPSFVCPSFILKQIPTGGYNLTFTTVNGLGFAIIIDEANLTTEDVGVPGRQVYSSTLCSGASSPRCDVLVNGNRLPTGVLKPGDVAEFSFLILENAAAPTVGSLVRARVSLAYRNCAVATRDCEDGTPHVISGRITTVVEPG
ncbi:MAG: hypothetical protein QXG98_00260 [Candidatus Micrarchaeia archaeon]